MRPQLRAWAAAPPPRRIAASYYAAAEARASAARWLPLLKAASAPGDIQALFKKKPAAPPPPPEKKGLFSFGKKKAAAAPAKPAKKVVQKVRRGGSQDRRAGSPGPPLEPRRVAADNWTPSTHLLHCATAHAAPPLLPLKRVRSQTLVSQKAAKAAPAKSEKKGSWLDLLPGRKVDGVRKKY